MFKKHFKYFILAISSALFITVLIIGLSLTAYGLGMETRRFAYSVKDHINKIMPKGKYTTKDDLISKSLVASQVGVNPETEQLYSDPNTVAIDMWKEESLTSLQVAPKPFIENGFKWIAQGGLKDLLAVDYKNTDFYLGKGEWDSTKPETAKWITHNNNYPYSKRYDIYKKKSKPLDCVKANLQARKSKFNPNPPTTCRVVDNKFQTLVLANYKGIVEWDNNKAQAKANTFNKSLTTLGMLLGKKDETGAIKELDDKDKDIFKSSKATDFYNLNYAKAFYRTRIGAIFLIILTPILGAFLIGINIFVFIKYRNGFQ